MSEIGATVYLCNPELNTKCAKTGCGYIHEDGPCFRTVNPEFAVVDDAGQPVKATEEDVEMIKQARSAPVQNWKVPGGIGYGIHLSSCGKEEPTNEDWARWGKNIPSQHQDKHDKKGGCNGDYCEL